MYVAGRSLGVGMDVSTSVSNVILGCSVFFMFQMAVSTEIPEAVNPVCHFIKQRATSNSVALTFPHGSRCSGHFSQLCSKASERELRCVPVEIEFSEVDSLTFVINQLKPNTSYFLKADNDTLQNCTVCVHTCPDEPPVVTNLHVNAMSRGFEVIWSPPQEECQSQYNYFLRYKSNDSEYTNWVDVKSLSNKNHNSSISDIRILLDDNLCEGKLSVQVRAQRAGEERGGEREAEAQAWERAPPHPAHAHWEPAWMSGLWAAVGAVAGLALVTILGVCYFDRRSKWRDAQKSFNNSAGLPTRPETLDDLLVPDIDILIDSEIAPEPTQPAAELPMTH